MFQNVQQNILLHLSISTPELNESNWLVNNVI
jgi:hypothetical protein